VAPDFDDAEYRRSDAAVAADALTAYNAGATGAGVKIAVLDSGLSNPGGEFSGRIDPASRDMAGNRGIADPDGHGTSVAAVAAAGRNGSDILGFAFGATVLALRTDDPGSCAGEDGCQHFDNVLASGVDVAVQNGARVINMSLGGSAATPGLVAAIGRATAAGVIVVISAGNDGAADPDPFAQVANSSSARGLVVIAGAHNASDQIASFSNRAGSFGQYYLTALGDRVPAFDQTGQAFLFSGTSYSAPAIAGAVALLAQAFPNLTAAQIVDLLYNSANDAGASGIDPVFGRGILDLARAFQPQGSMSLAGSAVPVLDGANATLGTAMGDARAGASLGQAVVLDGYQRAYALDLGRTIGRIAQNRPLARAIGGGTRSASAGVGDMAVSVTVAEQGFGTPWAGLAQLGLTREQDGKARALAGFVASRISPLTSIAFGFGESAGRLGDRLGGEPGLPYLIARGPADSPGFAANRGLAIAARHEIGRVAITVAAERGALARQRRDGTSPAYQLGSVSAQSRLGPLRLSAGVGQMQEQGSVLGSRFAPAFGGGGATTRFADIDARWALGGGWELGGAWRQGWTNAQTGGALERGRLGSSAFAFDIGRTTAGERFGLRVAQPLRVASGGYALRLPVSYDYATGAVSYELRRLDLAPQGRELDLEAAWGRRFGGGWLDANLYFRRDPGNIAAMPDDVGAVARFSLAF
jgi:hypothetical protein